MNEKTVTKYYQDDHSRLEKLFESYSTLKCNDFTKAKEYFKEFLFGLQKHIVWEETILFPAYEKKTQITTGPTEVMRQEHRLIKQCLESIHKKVKNKDISTEILEKELLALLAQHNLKEENILYPSIDNLTNEEEKNEIFKTMDNLPKEAYEHCCSN